MTFDEAMAMVGTYLINNDLSNSDNNDRFFYTILNDLRQEYAPTVEMTKEQYKTFNEDIQLNQKALDNYIDESMGLPKITNRQMLNLYIHPETIKIVDE